MVASPKNLDINYSGELDLNYVTNQTVYNYSVPNELVYIDHENSLNIEYSEIHNWYVSAFYDLNIINQATLQINHIDEELSYKIRNVDKKVYRSKVSSNLDLHYKDLYSFYICKTDLDYGDEEYFRLESFILMGIIPAHNVKLKYVRNQIIILSGEDYNTRVFEGDIQEITDCA